MSVGTVCCTRLPAQSSGEERAPGRLGAAGRAHSTQGRELIGFCVSLGGHA